MLIDITTYKLEDKFNTLVHESGYETNDMLQFKPINPDSLVSKEVFLEDIWIDVMEIFDEISEDDEPTIIENYLKPLVDKYGIPKIYGNLLTAFKNNFQVRIDSQVSSIASDVLKMNLSDISSLVAIQKNLQSITQKDYFVSFNFERLLQLLISNNYSDIEVYLKEFGFDDVSQCRKDLEDSYQECLREISPMSHFHTWYTLTIPILKIRNNPLDNKIREFELAFLQKSLRSVGKISINKDLKQFIDYEPSDLHDAFLLFSIRNLKNYVSKCIVCSTPFMSKNRGSAKQYCSRSCRNKMYNARKRT